MESFDHDPGEVFSIPDLWGPSRLLHPNLHQDSFLFSAIQLDDIDGKTLKANNYSLYNDGFFTLPEFSAKLSPDAASLGQSYNSPDNANDLLQSDPVDSDDIWLLPEDIPVDAANYQSWDLFDSGSKETHNPYVTEAGPRLFDSVVVAEEDCLALRNTEQRTLNTTFYTSSLLSLGLGRSSVLFAWNDDKQVFTPAVRGMRLSGYTPEAVEGLTAIFLDCGNMTRALQKYVEEAYTERKSPGRIALADAVSTLLSTVQADMSESGSGYNSLLQLQALFEPVQSILKCFRRLIFNVAETRDDESMLSVVVEEIQLLEHQTGFLMDVLLEVLARVSRPWLEFVSEWVGTRREAGIPITKNGSGRSFVQLDNKDWIDDQGLGMQGLDYVMDYSKVPSFVALDDAKMLFETGKSLRFLKEHQAEHPLCSADIVASVNPPSFEWKFSWQDIVQVEARALQYEKDLTAALRIYYRDASMPAQGTPTLNETLGIAELTLFGKPEEDMQAHMLADIDTFNQPLMPVLPDRLSTQIRRHRTHTAALSSGTSADFAPPIHLIPLLCFNPIIAAQARIVNLTSMRMLFNSHKVREHLSLQRRFQLLGDGVFSSRLSHALFDPELESAERHQGVARSGGIMGLRLGGRDTWPPASSELRLALMGVLTESYVSSQPLHRSRTTTYVHSHPSLPGDLSFAVRDMFDEEIEKCMNPDSLEALDFLRLSYKPPAPLESIITPIILYKYDRLFRLLLRVIRMLYVVSTLFRDATDRSSKGQDIDGLSQRFRNETQHFISSVSCYFFDTGIEATWRVFERKLDQIEARINSDDDDVTLHESEGLEKLKDYHDRVVDRIMSALLLRKRQQPVMKLLEEIFGLILQFSKHFKEQAVGVNKDDESNTKVRELYRQFRKKVGIFITVCKGLSEKQGYGEKRPRDDMAGGHTGLFDDDNPSEENTILQLVTRLDISGYYSKPVTI